jgi:hypothetical protein
MTQLIALLSTGKGSWSEVIRLMRQGSFDEVILITNAFGKEKFTPESKTSLIVTDLDAPVHTLQAVFLDKLRPLLKGTQVALNMSSGTGTEHMALLSAILKLGFAVRLVIAGERDFEEL